MGLLAPAPAEKVIARAASCHVSALAAICSGLSRTTTPVSSNSSARATRTSAPCPAFATDSGVPCCGSQLKVSTAIHAQASPIPRLRFATLACVVSRRFRGHADRTRP
jgi:hypothetical protein